jgi:AraC-like DNA-binding protein
MRLSREDVDAAVAAYQDGLTLKELASAFGADRRTLARHLEQRGVARRGPRLAAAQIEEAAALYRNGWSHKPQ